MEIRNPKKATSDYLASALGKYSHACISEEEKEATIGMKAHNNDADGNFAIFTDALGVGRVDLATASGQGQSCFNKDLDRDHESFVGGKGSREPVLGLFHSMPREL